MVVTPTSVRVRISELVELFRGEYGPLRRNRRWVTPLASRVDALKIAV